MSFLSSRVLVLALCVASLALTAPLPGQALPYNRAVEHVELAEGRAGTEVRILYGLTVNDDSSDTLVLSGDIHVLRNGSVVDMIAAPATKRGAIQCAVTCAGSCPSIFGDGVCTGCGCKYSNWFTSAFGDDDLLPGDEITVILRPAPGAAPELDTSDDTLTTVYKPKAPRYNRTVERVELAEGSAGTEVRILYGLTVNDDSSDTLVLSGDIHVLRNGSVVDMIAAPATKGGAIQCAVTCAGSCPSIFGDGVCTGCGCKYSNWFTSAFGDDDLLPGDEITVILRPAPGAVPELDTSDDTLTAVYKPEEQVFRRGDANGNGTVDIGDAIYSLGCLFLGTACPTCRDAADANDDGAIDIGDPIFELSFLFLGGPRPAAPGPFRCGPDETRDALPGCVYESCDVER